MHIVLNAYYIPNQDSARLFLNEKGYDPEKFFCNFDHS